MPRRILQGTVVSDKTDKTITVLVERRVLHPVYKKYVRQSKKYAAHDETNSAKTGETVSIMECRPISKTKTWVLVTGAETTTSTKAKTSKTQTAAKKPTVKTAAKKTAA